MTAIPSANVGSDKDSDKRQRAAITAFAKAQHYRIVDEFYDAAVSGALWPIHTGTGGHRVRTAGEIVIHRVTKGH
jgi:hypothetical protein